MCGTVVDWFRHLGEHLGVAILLTTLGCLPARGQDAGNFLIQQAAVSHAFPFNRNVCSLPSL
jgi:hypothetical protein